jgi:alpha-L-rhamnosidase
MRRIKFKDMPYQRPDLDKTKETVADLTERLSAAQSYEAAREVFLEHERLMREIMTLDQLSYIRHSIDTRDEFYTAERDFWDESRGGFIDSYTSGKNNITRHANIFAILYDFADAAMADRIYKNILCGDIAEPITTPYFKFFELMALGKMGDIIGTQDFIDSYWGGMLALGATSVWEQFDPRKEGRAHLEMYGMEYGCSLCHAWGSGPIALLGQFCAGVTPTDVAYKTFDVKPNPGKYKQLHAVVPVCGGTVTVDYNNGVVTASATVPGGTLRFGGKTADIPTVGEVSLTAE